MHSLENSKSGRRFEATSTRVSRRCSHLDVVPRVILVKYDGTVVVKRDTITVEV